MQALAGVHFEPHAQSLAAAADPGPDPLARAYWSPGAGPLAGCQGAVEAAAVDAVHAQAAGVAADWRAKGQRLSAQGRSSISSPAHEPAASSSPGSGGSALPVAGPGCGPGPGAGASAAPAEAAAQLRAIRPGVWACDALQGSSALGSLAATAAWLRDAAPAPAKTHLAIPEQPAPARQEPAGFATALGLPLGNSAPAAEAAGRLAQGWDAGASEGAAGLGQHADSLRGRLRQVLASATVQLPSQGPKRRRKTSSSAPSSGAEARVLEGRARLLVLAPRPDRPFSARDSGAGSGAHGDSMGSDVSLSTEETAESRARKDALLGVGAPVSEAARRLGLELGGDLPKLAPADGGAPPIIPDTIGLLGCGGANAEAPQGPPSAASAERSRERSGGAGDVPGGGEGEGAEEEPLLGHAWETGRCFTIPMTVMYRISTDLGQVGLLPFPFACICKSAPVIVGALPQQVLQPGPGLHHPMPAPCRNHSLACSHPGALKSCMRWLYSAKTVLRLTSTERDIQHEREIYMLQSLCDEARRWSACRRTGMGSLGTPLEVPRTRWTCMWLPRG